MLRQWISQEGSPEHWREIIAESYQLPADAISIVDVGHGLGHLLQWKQKDQWRHLNIDEGVVVSIGVDAENLTSAGVITCLGQPAYYSAIYGFMTEGGKQLDVTLAFPEAGVVAGGGQIFWVSPDRPPLITDQFAISSISIVQPGVIDELLQQAHTVYPPDLAAKLIQTYKPWPGNWSKVEVTRFEDLNWGQQTPPG